MSRPTVHRRSTWVLGLLTPLVVMEIGLRAVAPSLPSPAPWPSVGIEVKTDYAERLVGERLDVIFLGSSVSEAGIDPDQILASTGLSSFNAAGPYSTPVGIERWLDHGLWPLAPRTLVIGLSIWGAPDSAENDVLSTAFDALDDYERDNSSILGSSELWSRRAQLRDLIELVNDSVNAASYTDRGHLTIYRNGARHAAENLSEGQPFPGFSDDNLEALARITAEAERRDADVVLLLEPGGCPEILPGCANQDSEAVAIAAVAEIAESLDVDWINGREFIAPDEWYADSAHFNAAGTSAFTDFLADRLGRGTE